MSSRFFALFSLGLGVVLSACSLTTNDPPPPSSAIQLKTLDTACLDQAGNTMSKYFKGTAGEAEVSDFFDCLGKSLQTFADNTRGTSDAEYTGAELARFIERYFLKNKTIQPGFLDQAMRLKRALLGGNHSSLSRTQLNQTLSLIRIIKVEALRIRSFLPLDYEADSYSDASRLEEAMRALTIAADNIGTAIKDNAGAYSFIELSRLLVELEIFFNQGQLTTESTSWIRTVKDYIDVLKWGKSVLVLPPETDINQGDWEKLFYAVPRYYSLYLRTMHLFKRAGDILVGPNLLRVRSLVNDAHSLLSRSITHHPNQGISYRDINELIDALGKKQLLPIKASALRDFIPTAIKGILRNPTHIYGDDDIPPGVRQDNLDKLLQEFSLWSEGQFFLDGMYNSLAGANAVTGPGLSREQILAITPEQGLQWTIQKDQVSRQAIQDLLRTVSEIKPAFPGDSAIMVIPRRRTDLIYSYKNMIQMNWLKRGVKLLIESYRTYAPSAEEIAEKQRAAQNTEGADPYNGPVPCGDRALNVEQVSRLFADFFPMLMEFGLLDEHGADMAPKRFFEANLFLGSANGSLCLETNEGVEILASLLSVANVAQKAHDEIVKNGSCGLQADAAGKSLIEQSCFRRRLYEGRNTYWAQVPGFVAYLNTLPATSPNANLPPQVTDIYTAIYALAQDHHNTLWPTYTPVSETQGYMLMPYYVDMLYDRFDTNGSATVNKTEAMQALNQVFREFLRGQMHRFGLAPTDKNVEAAYTFMLYYGRLPQGCMEKIRFFLIWRNTYRDKDFEADRHRVYNIFATLLGFLYRGTNPDAPAPVSDCRLLDLLGNLLGGGKRNNRSHLAEGISGLSLSGPDRDEMNSPEFMQYMRAP